MKSKIMKNFFCDGTFYSDLKCMLEDYDIDENNVHDLPEEWAEKIEHTELEPIFKLDADELCQILADANEDRLSEDVDDREKAIEALKESVDFEKLYKTLPQYYYPNGGYHAVTKKDLLNYFK